MGREGVSACKGDIGIMCVVEGVAGFKPMIVPNIFWHTLAYTGNACGLSLPHTPLHPPHPLVCQSYPHFSAGGGAVEGDVKSPEESGNIIDAYKQLWQVIKLPAVRRFALVLITFR